MAVVEHPLQHSADQPTSQTCPQAAKGKSIVDFVAQDSGPVAVVEKPVSMVPIGKRPGLLLVGKECRRIVFRVDGHPANWQETQVSLQHHLAARPEGAA